MKKKKIVFSSSGGTPAMQLLLHLVENFGNDNIGRIAAQIAAVCSKECVLVTASYINGVLVVNGNTAMSVRNLGDCVAFAADNVTADDSTLIIE